MSSILFFLAAIIVIIFVIYRISSPTLDAKESRQELLTTLDIEKQFDIGKVLLRLGPILLGFGLIGYLVNRFWNFSDTRLILTTIFMVLSLVIGYTFYFLSKKQPAKKLWPIFSEAAMIVSSFLIGAELFAINGYFNDVYKYIPLGASEIFGIWSLALIPLIYLTRSKWLAFAALVCNFFWLAPYLDSGFNLIELFDFYGLPSKINQTLFLLLPTFGTAIYAWIYAWHQKNNHNKAGNEWRVFYYLSGLFTFFTAGALVINGILTNYDYFYNSLNQNNLFWAGDLLIVCITLATFAIDQTAKKTFKNYNVNIFGGLGILVAGLIGFVFNSSGSEFLPFLLLEIPLVIWLLADFLRQKSAVSETLFYVFNAAQLLLIVTSSEQFNWLKLLVLLGIMLYAAYVNSSRKGFVYYVVIAGAVALAFKTFIFYTINEFDIFLLLVIIGAIVTAFGLLFSSLRKKQLNTVQKKTD